MDDSTAPNTLRKKEDLSKVKHPISVCLNCFKIPLFNIYQKFPDEITIQCQCQSANIIPIKDYLKEIKHIFHSDPQCDSSKFHSNFSASQYCVQCKKWLCEDCLKKHNENFFTHQLTKCQEKIEINCQRHCEEKAKYYCLECKESYCSLCTKTHRKHQHVSFEDLIENLDINGVKKNLETAKHYISDYYNELKDQFLKPLMKKVMQVREAFRASQEKNEEMINFISILLDNYNPNNYYTISNIINNAEFKFDLLKVTDKTTTNELVNFLNTNTIINLDELFKKDDISSIISTGKSLIKINPNSLKEVKRIRKHTGTIYSLCLLKDGRLASCSWDKTINVYDLSTFTCDFTIEGHENTVTYVSEFDNGDLISCADDLTLKIWEIKKSSYTCKATIQMDTSDVWKVIPLSGNKFATCSAFDNVITIFENKPPYKQLKVLEGKNGEETFSILELYNKKHLVSGCFNESFSKPWFWSWSKPNHVASGSINFWDLESYRLEHRLEDAFCYWNNGMFELDDERLLVGGKGEISIIDCKIFQVVKKIKEESFGLVCCFLPIIDDLVLFGCDYGNIFLFDLETYRYRLVKEFAHKNAINAMIKVNETTLATCSWDGVVKFWQ